LKCPLCRVGLPSQKKKTFCCSMSRLVGWSGERGDRLFDAGTSDFLSFPVPAFAGPLGSTRACFDAQNSTSDSHMCACNQQTILEASTHKIYQRVTQTKGLITSVNIHSPQHQFTHAGYNCERRSAPRCRALRALFAPSIVCAQVPRAIRRPPDHRKRDGRSRSYSQFSSCSDAPA
jgi:hypothetical protein